jgi:predicted dehydrogenase
MNLLIVGCGMYVTGRNGTGLGTVLASSLQTLGLDSKSTITICATKAENDVVVIESAERLNKSLGLSKSVVYRQFDGSKEGLRRVAVDGKINAAIIATPDHLHFTQIKELISLGIHCLCVKPLVLEADEHLELIKLASIKNVHCAIEFHKRWDETNLHVKKALKEQKIGKLHNITVDYSQRIEIPSEVFKGWVNETNIFQYLGIHYVDLIGWLTESRPIRLFCHGTVGELRKRGIETWDSIHVWLIWRCKNGDEFLSQFNLSWIDSNFSPALSDQQFSILGSLGRYEVDQRNRGISLQTQDSGLQYLNPWFSELLPALNGGLEMQGYGFRSISQFLADAKLILSGQLTPASLIDSRPSFSNCLGSTKVIERVNSCLKNNIKEFVNV